MFFWMILLPGFLVSLSLSSVSGKLEAGHKIKPVNDKFITTHSNVGGNFMDWFEQNNVGDSEWTWFNSKYKDCMKLDLHVPESYDPLYICLKNQTRKFSAFDKNFQLKVREENGGFKIKKLDEVLKSGVQGHVIGMGVSFVRGYVSNGNFYGTIVYSHLIRKQMITCTVDPISMLKDFVDWKIIDRKTAEKLWLEEKANGGNAIVSCGDLHRSDDKDVENPLIFMGGQNPTNVVKEIGRAPKRIKRQQQPPENGTAVPDPPSPSGPSNPVEPLSEPGTDSTEPGNGENPSSPPPLASSTPGTQPPHLGRSLVQPGKLIDPSKYLNDEGISPDLADLKVEHNISKTALKQLSGYLKEDKHGTYYAQVCYLVDDDFVKNRLNYTAEELTLMLGGFVEMADWVLRSTDWNKDGIPDNIGIRLLEVSIDYITRPLRPQPGDPNEVKWGREEPNGKFESRKKVFNIVREAGGHLMPECDIRTGIGNVNVAKYVLREPGGCLACKHSKMTTFMNPYVEKYSPRGEYMRMMYHQIRLLTFSLVYTKNYCANCTDEGKVAKQSSAAGSFDAGDQDWGSCIVEGDLSSRSNIPLNTFRLSVCSQEDGLKCLANLAQRNNCLEFESEESYCGNGIIEGDEECDCGTLATCAEQHCTCSPRTGLNPCRKLHSAETRLCYTLIRCRGFRYLYEVGRPNGSHFLSALPDLLLHDGTMLGRRKGGDDDGSAGFSVHHPKSWGGNLVIIITSVPVLLIVITSHNNY